MTKFEVAIDPKDAAGAVAIDRIHQALLKALAVRMKTDKITRSDIAHRLGIDSSVVSNCFEGNQNISARMVGEILWALDYDFEIVLHDVKEGPNS
ncbi:helix-turn-helix domain-containing protein [Roseinatronobacter sp.]